MASCIALASRPPGFLVPDIGELVPAQRKFREYLCAVRREGPDGPLAARNLGQGPLHPKAELRSALQDATR